MDKIEAKARQKQTAKITGILAAITTLCVAAALVFNFTIMPNMKLNNAEKLINEGEYEDAYAILDELGKKEVIAESKYNRACEMIKNRNYKEAYEILDGLNYKDSEEKIAEISMAMLKQCNVGDTVFFGDYHGTVEWLVLDKQDGEVFLNSKYCLNAKPYNEKDEPVTWESCTLRQWLNGEFINETFTEEEKALICDTYLQNSDNPKYGTDGGNDTTDKVFFLSIDEAEKYFDNTAARRTDATDYAKGIRVSSGDGSWWWLRSPGHCAYDVAAVGRDGSVYYNGCRVYNYEICVRPAMWINLQS